MLPPYPVVFLYKMARVLASLRSDAAALTALAQKESLVVEQIHSVSKRLFECVNNQGFLLATGIGKSGMVAQRFAAALSSISCPSHFVHGTEWFHGNLGAVRSPDVVIAFSHSGSTKEMLALQPHVRTRGAMFVSVVGFASAPLVGISDHAIVAPAQDNICAGVPSRSIVAQEAVCNAIVTDLVGLSDFKPSDFGRNHPGGSLGDVLFSTE